MGGGALLRKMTKNALKIDTKEHPPAQKVKFIHKKQKTVLPSMILDLVHPDS